MSLKMEDTVKNRTYPKRPFAWYVEKPSAKDYLLTVFIFAVCTLIGLLFQKLDLTDTNIVTIYILGVLITSIVTDGYLCSVAGSFLSVFLFCFFLIELHGNMYSKPSKSNNQYIFHNIIFLLLIQP